MSDIDDIDGDEVGGGLPTAGDVVAMGLAASALCLACGGAISGPFCSACGQKNDDLRRSSFQLAKDFMGDTFGFDSRMWRTLGTLAASPGRVPRDYAHGKRSRFTPPVRLFIVVSFLFFLIIGLTNTLFVAVEVEFKHPAIASAPAPAKLNTIEAADSDASKRCSFQAKLRFFVKEHELRTDVQRLSGCFGDVGGQVREAVVTSDDVTVGEAEGIETERQQAAEVVDRVFAGLNSVIANPREFNDSFNDWLPRVLLAMTPVLALILTLFLRCGVLVFDHLVLSFYSHAVAFACIGLSLILAQIGAPFMGYAAFVGIGIYYIAELKKTYGRGWIKTIWTAAASGAIYLIVLLSIIIAIMSNVVWQAAT